MRRVEEEKKSEEIKRGKEENSKKERPNRRMGVEKKAKGREE